MVGPPTRIFNSFGIGHGRLHMADGVVGPQKLERDISEAQPYQVILCLSDFQRWADLSKREADIWARQTTGIGQRFVGRRIDAGRDREIYELLNVRIDRPSRLGRSLGPGEVSGTIFDVRNEPLPSDLVDGRFPQIEGGADIETVDVGLLAVTDRHP